MEEFCRLLNAQKISRISERSGFVPFASFLLVLSEKAPYLSEKSESRDLHPPQLPVLTRCRDLACYGGRVDSYGSWIDCVDRVSADQRESGWMHAATFLQDLAVVMILAAL